MIRKYLDYHKASCSAFSLRSSSPWSNNKILVNVVTVPAEKLLNYFIIIPDRKIMKSCLNAANTEKKVPNGVSKACCSS